jgi:SAM-dependent methyltransferase
MGHVARMGDSASEHVARNRAHWNERAPAHAASSDYGFSRFAEDRSYLSYAVRFDLPRLGSIAGLRGVHLQCHLGTDTVSLARLGARMTGVDFSPVALTEARRLAQLACVDVDFVESDVETAADVVDEGAFDLVYTGMGALCWLPRISRWAATVSRLLRPGGKLFMREAHPVLWSLSDDPPDGLLTIEHPYFERPEPTQWEDPGTYVATDAVFSRNVTYEWNHGLGEILSALHCQDLVITALEEHDSVPWNALPGLMEQLPSGEWRLRDRPWRLPHSYTLQAVKPG